MPPWPHLLAAGLGGPFLALAFPPHNLWFLAPGGLLPLLLICRRLSPLKAAFCAWIWGCGLCMATLPWIMHSMTVYGGLHISLALGVLVFLAGILGLYPALFAGMTAACRRAGAPLWASAPLAWAGSEWLRGQLLTGFPWLPLGGILGPVTPLMQSAELWGVTGVSALLVLFNGLLASSLNPLLDHKRWSQTQTALIAVAAFLAGVAWVGGSLRMDQVRRAMAAAPVQLVTVVQGNAAQSELWRPDLRGKVVERHIRLTRQAASQVSERPWLVVWAESAAPFYFLRQFRFSQPVLEAAQSLGAYIQVGSLGINDETGEARPANRSWLVGPQGAPLGYYDKVHLVPFGEYVPLEKVFFFVRAMAYLGDNIARGHPGKVLYAGRARLGTLICYESIFPGLARAMRAAGANLLVNQTNDAWFGTSGAAAQHMSHLLFRCVENRVACVRAANTGISGFITPDGSLHQTTGLFVPAVQSRRTPLLEMTTLFTRTGDLVGPGGLILSFLGAMAGWLRTRYLKEE